MKKLCMVALILGSVVSFSSCSKALKIAGKIGKGTSNTISHNARVIGYGASRAYRQHQRQQEQQNRYNNFSYNY